MGWESQLNRNEMARQSAALSKVAQGLDNLSETARSNNDLRRQLADAKAKNERLRKLVRRYYKKHHEAVMADAVRVVGGFTDCLCIICEEVRTMEATDGT